MVTVRLVTPASALSGCLSAHPMAELLDHSGLFEHRDELAGIHEPTLGMVPPDQCLHAGELTGRQVELRLLVEDK